MTFKFANEIINEIKARGPVKIPAESVSGEEFEEWLCTEKKADRKDTVNGKEVNK